MKKTEVYILMDRSGSMSGLEKDTIGGFNSFIEQQKKESGEIKITTVLFDSKIEILHDRMSVHEIKKMTNKDYYVRGCTALLDAIGFTLSKAIEIQKNLQKKNKANHIIFVITTDGYENSSHEYNFSQIQKMIQNQQKKYHWEFLFLGANIDAISEASKIGIHPTHAANFFADSEGVGLVYKAVSKFTSKIFSEEEYCEFDESWKEEIEEDFNKKNN